VVLGLAGVVVIVAGMRAAATLLVPTLLAVLLSTLLMGPMRWMVRRRVPKAVAVPLLMALLLALGSLAAGLVGAAAVELGSRAEIYNVVFQQRVAEFDEAVVAWLQRFGAEGPERPLADYLSLQRFITFGQQLAENAGEMLANGFLILIVLGFILWEAPDLRRRLEVSVGSRWAGLAHLHLHEIGVAVRRYSIVKTAVSLATGGAVYLALLILGVDFALLWGALAFALNYIPTVGSVIAAVPAVLLAWLQGGALTGVVTTGVYLAINTVLGNIVEPRFMGYGVGLSPLVLVVSLVFWGWVLGPVGMIASVPLTVMARLVLAANDSTRWMAVLISDRRSLQREAAAGQT